MTKTSTGAWRTHNKDVLARDLLRDFCTVHATLLEQAARFSHSQTISYAILRELLGEVMHKGVFWRLKDTAYLLFRKETSGTCGHDGYDMEEEGTYPDATPSSEKVLENMLHWCIGYAFHECVKLKEDAFQRQHYTNRLVQLEKRSADYADIIASFKPLTEQTKQSIEREIQRILHVFAQARALFSLYFAAHKNNAHVARFLLLEEGLATSCFKEEWQNFLENVYGQDKVHMHILAAKACLEGGHPEQARTVLDKAQASGLEHPSLQALQQELENNTRLEQVNAAANILL